MSEILKRPQVIRDLIDIAIYIAENNLDSSDRFLYFAVKGFRNYLIFYQIAVIGVEILRVIHGARDIETILERENDEET